jgi:hypothetical protein
MDQAAQAHWRAASPSSPGERGRTLPTGVWCTSAFMHGCCRLHDPPRGPDPGHRPVLAAGARCLRVDACGCARAPGHGTAVVYITPTCGASPQGRQQLPGACCQQAVAPCARASPDHGSCWAVGPREGWVPRRMTRQRDPRLRPSCRCGRRPATPITGRQHTLCGVTGAASRMAEGAGLPWLRVPVTIECGVKLSEAVGLNADVMSGLRGGRLAPLLRRHATRSPAPRQTSPHHRMPAGLGYVDLFPVQATVWRQLAGGHSTSHDVCIAAPTGSGKTLAYVLPVLHGLRGRWVQRRPALAQQALHTRRQWSCTHTIGTAARMCVPHALDTPPVCGLLRAGLCQAADTSCGRWWCYRRGTWPCR